MVRSPERIVYNKLVRDKIPEIIEKEGKYPEISIIEDEKEYQKAVGKTLKGLF
jgi:predicted house-cleaning noncanonical NTP pyrophosphatase (MazG superfamily)